VGWFSDPWFFSKLECSLKHFGIRPIYESDQLA
jgi:hypothetical protein